MKKLIAVLFIALLSQSCKKPMNTGGYEDLAVFGFYEGEQIVEVDPSVTSFRLEGEWIDGAIKDYGISSNPSVTIVEDQTTAKHNVHFINDVSEDVYFGIGDFTFIDTHKMYRDIEIIPKNITEEVRVVYNIVGPYECPQNFFDSQTVILRPKVSEE